MAKNYDSPGDVNDKLTAPAGGVVAGNTYKIGTGLFVATTAAAVGEKFTGAMVGSWWVAKVSAQAWNMGDKVYWDDTAKLWTIVVGTNTVGGMAWAPATNPSALGLVRLDGTSH